MSAFWVLRLANTVLRFTALPIPFTFNDVTETFAIPKAGRPEKKK